MEASMAVENRKKSIAIKTGARGAFYALFAFRHAPLLDDLLQAPVALRSFNLSTGLTLRRKSN
jgi:hypothetical protein